MIELEIISELTVMNEAGLRKLKRQNGRELTFNRSACLSTCIASTREDTNFMRSNLNEKECLVRNTHGVYVTEMVAHARHTGKQCRMPSVQLADAQCFLISDGHPDYVFPHQKCAL